MNKEIEELNQGWLGEEDRIVKRKVDGVTSKRVIRIFKNNSNKIASNLKELRKIDIKDHETPNWKFRCYLTIQNGKHWINPFKRKGESFLEEPYEFDTYNKLKDDYVKTWV